MENLIDKIMKSGVEFPNGVPTRWHHKLAGQIWRTYLCYEVIIYRGRIQLDGNVKWIYKGHHGNYVEAQDTIQRLTKRPIILEVNYDSDLSSVVLEVK